MSSKNNVNPDHYKVRGSLRQGEDVIPELEKKKAAASGAHRRRRGRKPGGPRAAKTRSAPPLTPKEE